MNGYLAAVIPALFFILLALSAWYVDARLRMVFGWARPRWSARIVTAVAAIGTLGVLALTATSAHPVAGPLYLFTGYLISFYLFVLLALVIQHVVQTVWRPAGGKWGGIAVLVVALLATGVGALSARHFVVKEDAIRIAGLTRGLKVMHISDVHLGHHRGGTYLAQIVAETNRRRPDFIVITGDLLDSNAALLPGVLDPLGDFAAPVYYVGGNHENDIDTARALQLIAAQGVHVLHNAVVETHGIQLIGLDYMKPDADTFDMHPSTDTRTIRDVMHSLRLDATKPSVVLHHSSVGVGYIEQAGIKLMLAGHTHGGQMFPVTWIADLLFPFNRGLYREGGTQIYVSQGVGTFLVPLRLGSANEINLLHLLPDNG